MKLAKYLLAALAGTALISYPALADQHEAGEDAMEEVAEAVEEAMEAEEAEMEAAEEPAEEAMEAEEEALEAAEEALVSTATLYSLANQGKLPGARRIGKRIIIHRETFLRWLADGMGE